jgi:hypothetical protein
LDYHVSFGRNQQLAHVNVALMALVFMAITGSFMQSGLQVTGRCKLQKHGTDLVETSGNE